jgi:hypothetical protein
LKIARPNAVGCTAAGAAFAAAALANFGGRVSTETVMLVSGYDVEPKRRDPNTAVHIAASVGLLLREPGKLAAGPCSRYLIVCTPAAQQQSRGGVAC